MPAYANDYTDTLASELNVSATTGGTITVTAGCPVALVGEDGFIRVGTEILEVTFTTSTSWTIISREVEDSTRFPKATWPALTQVLGGIPTAGSLADLGGGSAEVLTGKQLRVDSVNGNNTTGTRGEWGLPYLTLAAAKTAAQSGDTIFVGPGTYNEKNLLKNGVNWHFEAGASVTYSGSSTGGIFDDTATGANGAVTCKITGAGVFSYRGTHASTGQINTTRNVAVLIENASSDVEVEAATIEAVLDGVHGHAIFQADGDLKIKARTIFSAQANGAFQTGAIYWDAGDLVVKADVIDGTGGYALYTQSEGHDAADCYVECALMIGGFSLSTDEANTRWWVRVLDHQLGSIVFDVFTTTLGKFYYQAEKFEGLMQFASANGKAWLRIDKAATSAFQFDQPIISHTGAGLLDVDIGHVEDTVGVTTLLQLKTNASIRVGQMIMHASGTTGVSIGTGGVFSGRIDASAATSGNAVKVTASGATLKDTAIVAGTGRTAVAADSAFGLNVEGELSVTGGTGIDADVTLTYSGTGLAAKQPSDATLTALAAANWVANALPIGTGADTLSQTTFAANTFPARASTGNLVAKTITDFGLSLVDDADASTARTTLGLVIGTNVQAFDAELAALAGLTSAADALPYFTGSGTAAVTTFTSYARTLADDANAATARATLELATFGSGFFWQSPSDGTLTLEAKASVACTIHSIRGLATSAGTLTLTVKINGTNVTGLAALSVTSTPQDATASAANAVAVGDKVTLVIASSSSPANLEFTLQTTR